MVSKHWFKIQISLSPHSLAHLLSQADGAGGGGEEGRKGGGESSSRNGLGSVPTWREAGGHSSFSPLGLLL